MAKKNGNGADKFGPVELTCQVCQAEIKDNPTFETLKNRCIAKIKKAHPEAVILEKTARLYMGGGYHDNLYCKVSRERTDEEKEILKIEAIELIKSVAASVGLDVATVARGKK